MQITETERAILRGLEGDQPESAAVADMRDRDVISLAQGIQGLVDRGLIQADGRYLTANGIRAAWS